jgi:hypothetical protein
MGYTPPSYAPEYRLTINGDEVPAAMRAMITSVRYEDGIASLMNGADGDGKQAADRVEIELANVDLRWLSQHIRGLGFQPFPTDLRLGPLRVKNASAAALHPAAGVAQHLLMGDTPEGLFDIDNKLTLAMGYADGPLQEMFVGEITGVEADFPSGGVPSMRIVAHDYLRRLAEGSYARGFGLLPDWLIAGILSAENLLLPAVDPVVGAASTAMTVLNAIFGGTGRKQRGQSDLQLLQEIADNYDADFWVEGDVLYLSRVFGKEFSPRATYRWGESLLSFSPAVSVVGQVIGVAVKFTLPLIPIDFVLVVGWDFDRESLNLKVVPGATAGAMKSLLGGPVMSLIERKLESPQDIVNSALALTRVLRSKINNRLTGSASAVGDPQIRAGAMLLLDGMGPDFSGNYRVTSATHTIDQSGYRTSFKVRREILP